MIEIYGAGFDERDPRWKKQLSQTNTYAVALIISGKLSYRIDGTTLYLSKGDLLFIPTNCMREASHVDQDHHQKYWATFVMSRSDLDPLPMLTKPQHRSIRTRQYEYFKQRFSLLVQQWMGKLPYYTQICSAIVMEMLVHVNRELDSQHHPSPKLDLITNIQKYVLAHYREDIRVDELANHMNRSPNYISSLFRRMTGDTVKAYIHQVKLSAARDLLLHSDLTIGQAAEYVGFCDQAYFNRVFKKHHGFPPSVLLKERK
jgi:AraC-like DNA-binding protein